jgi:hypothetical protein
MVSLLKRCLTAKYRSVGEGGDYAVELNGDTLSLLFEWSDSSEDWKNNFDFPAKPYKHMEHLWFCHRGFLKVWKAIELYLIPYIEDQNIRRIEIVGYSHGAAIALLCYEYCIFHRPDAEVRGVGFGCPRVFWGIVPKEVKRRFDSFRVVRNGIDIVTHVPPAIFGYRHISQVVKIGKGDSKGLIKDHYAEEYILHLEDRAV